jgi:hypothetical protein
MSSDIGLGVVGIPNAGGMSKKPPHLIEMTEGKSKVYFLSTDRPELQGNFVQVKGSFVSSDQIKELEADAVGFVSQVPKENIYDMLLPTHRILSIKNLAFKAK